MNRNTTATTLNAFRSSERNPGGSGVTGGGCVGTMTGVAVGVGVKVGVAVGNCGAFCGCCVEVLGVGLGVAVGVWVGVGVKAGVALGWSGCGASSTRFNGACAAVGSNSIQP